MKKQITTTDSKRIYEIRTEPHAIVLKKNQTYEFSIIIKHSCTCELNDKIYYHLWWKEE